MANGSVIHNSYKENNEAEVFFNITPKPCPVNYMIEKSSYVAFSDLTNYVDTFATFY